MEPIDQEIPTGLTERRYIMQIDGAYYFKHIKCEDWFKKEKALQQQKAFAT